jgi:hypothetical protein
LKNPERAAFVQKKARKPCGAGKIQYLDGVDRDKHNERLLPCGDKAENIGGIKKPQ